MRSLGLQVGVELLDVDAEAGNLVGLEEADEGFELIIESLGNSGCNAGRHELDSSQ
jgi:hypothetical protein